MSASKDCKYTMWYVNNCIPDEDGLLMVSLPSFLSDCLDGSLDVALYLWLHDDLILIFWFNSLLSLVLFELSIYFSFFTSSFINKNSLKWPQDEDLDMSPVEMDDTLMIVDDDVSDEEDDHEVMVMNIL